MFHRGKGYVAFDLETDGLFDGDTAPLITCACTIHLHRHGVGSFEPSPALHWHSDIENSDCMQAFEIFELVNYLFEQLENGYPPVTWNGAGFDFRVLHANVLRIGGTEAAGVATKIARLARFGVDPMFNFFMHNGFPVGLSAVASGFGIKLNKSGKGSDAITAWRDGSSKERFAVINYCERDVAVLCMVTSAIDSLNAIKWITKKAKASTWSPRKTTDSLMVVHTAAALPEPDNQWMSAASRPHKSQFVGWFG